MKMGLSKWERCDYFYMCCGVKWKNEYRYEWFLSTYIVKYPSPQKPYQILSQEYLTSENWCPSQPCCFDWQPKATTGSSRRCEWEGACILPLTRTHAAWQKLLMLIGCLQLGAKKIYREIVINDLFCSWINYLFIFKY